jgi:hypothetical protein
MLKSLILAVALTATIAVALTATIAVSAEAAGRCGERQGLLERLSETYGEAHVAIGTAANGAILEVLASKNGSWTALISRPDGTSCVVATGQNWEVLPLQTADLPV